LQIALHSDIASDRRIQDAQATRLLVENGFDIKADNFNANKTLLWAATKDHGEEMVQLLLRNGADIDAKDNYGRTALHSTAQNGQEAVLRLLLEKEADAAAKDNYGRTALHSTAQNEQEAVVRLLLEKGAGGAAKDNDG
jgi:ankyrin repeat protein